MPPAPPARPFSATDAAFAGFRLARARPQALVALTAVNLLLGALTGVAMEALAGPDLARMQALGPRPDPAEVMALFGRLLPFYGLMSVLLIVFYAVVYATVCRAMLRPGGGWGGLVRLGRDEVRQGLLLLLLAVLFFALYLGLAVMGFIAVGLVSAAVPGAPAKLLVILLSFGVLGLLLFAAVRLALASPVAFEEGRIDLKGAWRMTRGRFWPLLGAYALAVCVLAVVGLTFLVAYAALGLAVGGGAGLKSLFQPDVSHRAAAYFSPMTLLYMVLSSVLNALIFAVLVGVGVDAYRQLAGRGSAPGADARVVDRSTHFGLHV